jgi:hypothetical protein
MATQLIDVVLQVKAHQVPLLSLVKHLEYLEKSIQITDLFLQGV